MPEPLRDLLRGDEVEVLINRGKLFEGEQFADWESIEVRRTIAAAVGSFRISVGSPRPWPLGPETAVTIRVAGTPIITGFVDQLDSLSSGDRRGLTFAGRDAAAQLVDCSAMNEPGEWRNLTVIQLARELADPFGIKIETQGLFGALPADVLPVFTLQPGEKAWTALERLVRLRGLLAYSLGNGSIKIGRAAAGFSSVDLIEGEPAGNVLESRVRWTHEGRFQTYTVRGQATGGDEGWGSVVIQPEGVAIDESIERFRPLLILAEGQVSEADAQTRAEWEASTRAARASVLEVKVAGWRKDPEEPELWAVNERVNVDIPSQGLSVLLMVEAVTFTRTLDGGAVTKLRLVRPDSYDPKPAVEPSAEPFSFEHGFLGDVGDDLDDGGAE